MYIQAMDTMVPHEGKKAICSTEEMRQDEHFEARIDDGDFIEVKNWMPKPYRKTLISQHAHSEIVGMLLKGN